MSFFLHTCIVFTQHIYAVTFHVVWGDSVKSVVQVMTKRTQKAGQAGQKGGGKTNGVWLVLLLLCFFFFFFFLLSFPYVPSTFILQLSQLYVHNIHTYKKIFFYVAIQTT